MPTGSRWGKLHSEQRDELSVTVAGRIPATQRPDPLLVCRGGLLQTDPQERAKTTTASSDCRPRPTAPDPVVSQGNSQMQAKAGQTNAGEATSTQHRSTRAGRCSYLARNIEVREQLEYPNYLHVVSHVSLSEVIIHPSWHRGPPATRARWRPEVALAG